MFNLKNSQVIHTIQMVIIYFQLGILMHSKIYKCKFLFDVNFAPNYIEKLKLVEMEIITIL